jgi:hypothetical protein
VTTGQYLTALREVLDLMASDECGPEMAKIAHERLTFEDRERLRKIANAWRHTLYTAAFDHVQAEAAKWDGINGGLEAHALRCASAELLCRAEKAKPGPRESSP